MRPQSLAMVALHRRSQGARVIAGPFAGMKFIASGPGSAHYAKVLGTYEMELSPIVERLCTLGYVSIVDVGAAEGYYAVGFALRCPMARVTAFEIENSSRELLLEHARLNDVVDRIELLGFCDTESLSRVLASSSGRTGHSTLLIMDVEGHEDVLLRPEVVPQLATTDILVEVHDCYCPGLGARIESRFQRSHIIERVWARSRKRVDLPFRTLLLDRWLLKLTTEFRPSGMSWLYMTPKVPNPEPL
jgi:hypothetical protein